MRQQVEPVKHISDLALESRIFPVEFFTQFSQFFVHLLYGLRRHHAPVQDYLAVVGNRARLISSADGAYVDGRRPKYGIFSGIEQGNIFIVDFADKA